MLSSEHRAAAPAPPVYLELVATPQTTHLAVIAEPRNEHRCSLEDRVLERLAAGGVLTRAQLRQTLAVKNERLGAVLQSLEHAGRIGRQATGWQFIP